jgi:hypothetical protein
MHEVPQIPYVAQRATMLATELGVMHAMDGREQLTDRTEIRRYVEAYVDIMDGELLPDHLMALTPDFYASGFSEGSKPPMEKLDPRIHESLIYPDSQVRQR